MKFKYNGKTVDIKVSADGKKYDEVETDWFLADLALAAMHASTFQACQGNKPSSDFYFELAKAIQHARSK